MVVFWRVDAAIKAICGERWLDWDGGWWCHSCCCGTASVSYWHSFFFSFQKILPRFRGSEWAATRPSLSSGIINQKGVGCQINLSRAGGKFFKNSFSNTHRREARRRDGGFLFHLVEACLLHMHTDFESPGGKSELTHTHTHTLTHTDTQSERDKDLWTEV